MPDSEQGHRQWWRNKALRRGPDKIYVGKMLIILPCTKGLQFQQVIRVKVKALDVANRSNGA
jgi:hypothetical protein